MGTVVTDIEKIDSQIIKLIDSRSQLLGELSPNSNKNQATLPKNVIEHFMRELELHRILFNQKYKVGYLGPEGTFSHMIAQNVFATYAELVPQKTIEDVFKEVMSGNLDNGIVPIENSINGSVAETLDQLMKHSSKIQAEATLEINHCLFSNVDLKNIKTVYSHPQALGQCYQWLRQNLLSVDLVETSSTTSAIKKALTEPNTAAIGAKISASHYDIKLLKENIQDLPFNMTRFLVIGNEIPNVTGSYKTSLTISLLQDRPGALYEILKAFNDNKINLTRIESRPSRKQAWSYNFLIDIEGNIMEEKVQKALNDIHAASFSINILGSYRKTI